MSNIAYIRKDGTIEYNYEFIDLEGCKSVEDLNKYFTKLICEINNYKGDLKTLFGASGSRSNDKVIRESLIIYLKRLRNCTSLDETFLVILSSLVQLEISTDKYYPSVTISELYNIICVPDSNNSRPYGSRLYSRLGSDYVRFNTALGYSKLLDTIASIFIGDVIVYSANFKNIIKHDSPPTVNETLYLSHFTCYNMVECLFDVIDSCKPNTGLQDVANEPNPSGDNLPELGKPKLERKSKRGNHQRSFSTYTRQCFRLATNMYGSSFILEFRSREHLDNYVRDYH